VLFDAIGTWVGLSRGKSEGRRGWIGSEGGCYSVTAGQLNSPAPVVSIDGKKLYVVGEIVDFNGVTEGLIQNLS